MTGEAITAAVIVARISFVLILIVGLASLLVSNLDIACFFSDAIFAVLALLISAYLAPGKTAQAHEIVVAGIAFTAI